ncbi:MAG: group II intron reverse transcriptase/maturase [candidate division WOR-3 bacterium]
MARYQRDRLGTRESHNVPCNLWRRAGNGLLKPEEGKVIQMALWQSDKPIVARKQSNVCKAKGLTGMRWEDRDTTPALRGGYGLSTKLSSLTLQARENPKRRFTSLAHLLTADFLRGCFKELKKDKASGIDGRTYREYERNLKENLKDLESRLKGRRYRPKPVRRVYITDTHGKRRPLGIPAIKDKIVQMAIKKILEAIFEVDFLDVSFGFRPNRGCHDALDELDRIIMTKPVNFVVDMDIEKFFDSVNHNWLMECIRQRVVDKSFLRIIERFLKAGIMEEGKYFDMEKGVPQGAVLSPILANIYLHYILDLWFEREVKKRLKGYAGMVRYADDFIVCFQAEREAKVFRDMLRQRLGKFGLRIARDKSRVIEFGRYVWGRARRTGERLETFDFLGFTHYCDKTRRGKFKLGRKTSEKRFQRGIKAIWDWLKGIRNRLRLKEWWQMLAIKLIGHYRYYGISGNMRSLKEFFWLVIKAVYKWINRRSQKKSGNWEWFKRIIRLRNPLPKPKIYHPYPILKGCIPEEPNDRIGQVRFCEGHCS